MDIKRSVHSYNIEDIRTASTDKVLYEAEAKTTSFRRLLSQFIAASSINLILFDIGLALSYPTLVVPALLLKSDDSNAATNLTSFANKSNPDAFYHLSFFKDYHLTTYQTTWYVSIVYICQPIGSILGGAIIGYTGRKKLMQMLNIFMLCGWILPFFSTGPIYMFLSNTLFGIGIGCSEAPIATYLGEVTEVPVRGFILNFAQVFLSMSFLVPYLVLLAISSWRWQALVLSSLPVLTFLFCCFVPETPAWLISKGRYQEAEKSLRWLRGWTSSSAVRDELDDIIAYHIDVSKSYVKSSTTSLTPISPGAESESIKDKVMYFFSARMRKPLVIVCIMFAMLYVSGMCTIRPYLVLLVQEMRIDMNPDTCALWVTFAGTIGNIVSLILIKFTGKRVIVLTGLAGSAVCTFIVALIKMDVIKDEMSFTSFLGMSFFSGYGIVPIPWMLQSELYPFRGRGVASGLGAAFSYLIGFVATKSFMELTGVLTLQGVFILFTVFSLSGIIYFWLKLPETEGRTFEEIDRHFNKGS